MHRPCDRLSRVAVAVTLPACHGPLCEYVRDLRGIERAAAGVAIELTVIKDALVVLAPLVVADVPPQGRFRCFGFLLVYAAFGPRLPRPASADVVPPLDRHLADEKRGEIAGTPIRSSSCSFSIGSSPACAGNCSAVFGPRLQVVLGSDVGVGAAPRPASRPPPRPRFCLAPLPIAW